MRYLLPTLLLVTSSAFAASPEPVELFNGKNLDGWKVTGTEVEVKDGVMRLVKNDGFVRSEQKYKDFTLEVEWRALPKEKYDSGIYIRSEAPPEGKPWPARYQINLLDGDEGNLLGVKEGGKSKGLIKKGEWNTFKVTVLGSTAEMEINGKPAWKATGLEAAEGYIGIQSEVPKGGQFEFRKFRLTPLGPTR